MRLDRLRQSSWVLAVVVTTVFATPSPDAYVSAVGGIPSPACPVLVPPTTWSTKALGSSSADFGNDVVTDDTICAIFAGGQTFGALAKPPAIGNGDAFLARYSTTGALVWLKQFGTTAMDGVDAIAVDAEHNLYAAGHTSGTMPGSPMINLGGADMFLAKYDANGTPLWTRQLGSTMNDFPTSIAVGESGEVFVTGWTEGTLIGVSFGGRDYFLARYDVDGNLLMLIQRGTSGDDLAHAVAIGPAGNAYIAGETTGALGGVAYGLQDIFVGKYDAAGAQIWIEQRGTPQLDAAYGVAVNADGQVFVVGASHGDLDGHVNQGALDIVVLRYDASGIWRWTDERGTPETDIGKAVALSPNGAPYTTGLTGGALDGNIGAGGSDVFVMKHGRGGAWHWTTQLGTASENYPEAIAVDRWDHPYVTGYGAGTFGGVPNAGSWDAFVVKYDNTGVLR